ncbi:MAG: hypothetical protein RIC55_01275 [Pirellulaceae bacterium]
MHSLSLLAFIVASVSAPHSDGPATDMTPVYRCDFGEASDANYDTWPDGWTRRTGRDYPAYVKIEIVKDDADASPCLAIQLDGGAATAYSPPIPVSSQFNYVLEARMKAVGLKHDFACISLTFYDRDRNPIGETVYCEGVRNVREWIDVQIDVTTPVDDRVCLAVIGVHIRPETGHDLVGSAAFDELRLTRLPKMQLDATAESNLFRSRDDVNIRCSVSGISQQNSRLQLELFDVAGTRLQVQLLDVAGERIDNTLPLEETIGSHPGIAQDAPDAFSGSVTWKPEIPDYGFYRIQACLVGHENALLCRETSVAVLRPLDRSPVGKFGWSLTGGDDFLSLEQLSELLPRVGVNWVKFPIWNREVAGKWPERFTRFCERLEREHVTLVAVVDQPPHDVRKRFPVDGDLPAATVFLEGDQWPDALDPVVARHSLRIRWWQLGADGDTSFVGLPELPKRMAEIQTKMQRYGQIVRLGFACGWNDDCQSENPPWSFLARQDRDRLSAEELQASVKARAGDVAEDWITIRPLTAKDHTVEERAKDLVQRLVAAYTGGADRIFFDAPFDVEEGLFDGEGNPRELLLVWRTVTQLLSGSEYLGSIELPQGSRNHVFARDGAAIMLLWNDATAQETLYLGENVEQVDLWGRSQPAPTSDGRQSISVGAMPVFLFGLDEQIARWRIDFAFAEQPLESVFGRRQTSSFRFRNSLATPVTGTVRVVGPSVWQIEPEETEFQLQESAELNTQFAVFLGADASSGPQPVRFDFHLVGDKTYDFSVYRTVRVGLGDVEISLETHLTDDGLLEVKQLFTNNTDQEVSFNCTLYAPKRPRERILVTRRGRGEWPDTIFLTNGDELIGKKLWLRAEEVNGARILNYTFTARP